MKPEHLIEREITSDVIGAFYEVYNQLGFGFLEFIYALALEKELLRRGRAVGREVAVPVIYKGEVLANQRVDMVVDDRILVDIKSTEILHPRSGRLTLNYLRSTRVEVALLLHVGPKARFYRFVSYYSARFFCASAVTENLELLHRRAAKTAEGSQLLLGAFFLRLSGYREPGTTSPPSRKGRRGAPLLLGAFSAP